ncbi:autotransporter-associated beta strand repeat-containing protein [Luteolibacter flavescens]|uniref:Autotransporter-associated beta strand repeat-containing protein n=1 Tax=Luteolibacter flavescens TaxID=1859460 RepID=A0ABT3FQD4_9BACT|nr:autotransporter-associated beta strand repeat-containing protein [Luteolibacter flavescens]MCW1885441.1 autotransporter-associated beta strand repeat-containing protein [Luteolibacter flavescens]
MKSKYSPIPAIAISVSRAAALMTLAATPGAFAVSATWTGATDATWATAANWSASPVPGSATNEVATFATAGGADDVINLGSGVTVRSILFDTAAAAPYVIGSGAVGSQTLTIEGAGGITVNATVAANQVVNANLNLGTAAGAEGVTLTNSKAAASNSLTVAGGISTTQTGTKTLTVAGTGVTNVSGAISNGSGTLALAKTGAHVLTLSGANSYSGGTTISGVLNAANSSALGTGGVTINSGNNQLQLGAGVNIANALTLNGGGITGQGVIHLPGDSATYSGPINITAATNAGGVFATAGTGKLTVSGAITSTIPITVRSGHVVYTGAQAYTTGTAMGTVDSRSMIQFGKIASMPATGAVTATSGNSVAINVGGTGEFTATGTGAGTIAGLLAGTGGQGAAVTLPAGTSVGIDTTNAPGTVTYGNAFTTTNNLGLIKLGTGTLELTAGGTYTGAGAAAFPLVVRQGTLLLNGGAHTPNGEVVIGGTFGRANGSTGLDAKLRLDAGSLTTSNWLSIGRGNGIGGVSSDLELNNAAAITAGNVSAGFDGGSAANLPKGTITLNGTSSMTISGNGELKLAESAGTNMTMTLNDSATLTAAGTGIKYLGNGGLGTFNVNGSSTVNFGTGITYIGFQTGTGVATQSGGTFTTGGEVRVGGSVTNGTGPNGTGSFTMTGGTANFNALTIARGNNNQNTVAGTVTVGGTGTLNTVNDVILGFAGNNNLGKLVVSGGTLNLGSGGAKWLISSYYDTAKGQVDVTGGSLNLINNSSIKGLIGNTGSSGTSVINQTGGSVTFFSDAGTTVGGTGVLDLALSGSATSSSIYNLDGGTLTVPSVVSTNTSGTRLFNFNGGTLKAAANGTLMNFGGSMTTVRANVRDAGAIIDTNAHNVTIQQTLEQSNVVGDAGTGGLTKKGAGTLVLGGFGNSYTGTTNVDAGTLDVQGTMVSPIVVKSGATLAGSGSTSGSLTMQSGSTLSASTTFPLVANGVTFSGPTNLVFSGTPINGNPYTLFQYGAGGVTGLANLSSSGFRTVITNDTGSQQVIGTVTTGSLTWNSTNGTWGVNTTGWSGGFSNYFNGDAVTFNERPAASTVTLNGTLLPASVVVNNTANPYFFTGSGSIGGETTLTKTGAGTLTIAAANTYTGGTTLEAGTLNINGATALGTGLLTINGGMLDNTSGEAIVMTSNFQQAWNTDINFIGSSSLDMGTGGVSMFDAVLTDRTVTVAANTLGVGEITSGALGLTKQGTGTLVVASNGAQAAGSVIGGTLNVANGTLQINRSGTDGAHSGDFTATGLAGTGTITNGAAVERWLFINPTADQTFAGTLANGGTGGLGINKGGTANVTLSGTLSYTGTTTVGGGILSIPVANTGTGTGASVNAGTLVLGNPTALGTPANPAAPNVIRMAGTSTLDLAHDGGGPIYGFATGTPVVSTVLLNRSAAGAGITHALTTAGANGVGGGTISVTNGANVTSGTSHLNLAQFGLGADTVQTTILNPVATEAAGVGITIGTVSKLVGATAQTLELGGTTTDNQITGLISNGTAAVTLAKTNSSTWTISGANNTYTGGTRIGAANGAGVLRVTATAALGTGTVSFDGTGGAAPGGPTSRLELAGGITLANAMTLNQRNNASAAILNVSGNNTLSGSIDLFTGGNRANIQSDAGLLTLSGAILTTTGNARNLYLGGAGNGVASGSISNGTGSLSVTKEGTGTWTLSATNIYTGATTVSGGTLSIAQPSLADGAAVNVAATAVLNLTHSGTDTVDRFQIDGVDQAPGTWGSLTSSATNKTARITGPGMLLATNGTTPPTGGFSTWATALGLTAANNLPGQNPDNDGFDNGLEYILGGHPLDGANNPKVHTFITDSSDAGTEKELVMTIAVPQGTPAFPTGVANPSVTFEGYTVRVRGGTDLASFNTVVNVVDPVTTGLPAATFQQGGITYEYRSFSLGGSNGTPGKGFLQVTVTNP